MENKKEKQNRRYFIKSVGSAIGAGLVSIPLSQFIFSCEHQEPTDTKDIVINLSQYPVLSEIGKFIRITKNNMPMVIIRQSQTEFAIFSLICTHQGCEVDVPDSNNAMHCYCHNSIFSSNDGSVIKKPDDGSNISPLKKFQYIYDSDSNQLTIKF